MGEMEAIDRDVQLRRMERESFDLLVIGGGATGAGVALDAASRGMSVALVEATDFAAGSSSRSTKLLHGGVRYLEKAVFQMDKQQYELVCEALHERATAMQIAPHLTRRLPILTPVYNWWELPYYWLGLKTYDWLSGERSLGTSRYLSAEKALEFFPHLSEKGLKGGVMYFDGQFDDARFNVSLAMTAAAQGAAVANHLRVSKITKESGKTVGVEARDAFSEETLRISARLVVNATGPMSESVRQLDDPDAARMVTPSSGTHVILDAKLCPQNTGMLIPHTSDGRVLFLLPWEGMTLAGTTDRRSEVEEDPQPSQEDIDYILEHLNTYLHTAIARGDVRAAWTGLRPLVRDPASPDTQELLRNHLIHLSQSGLLTIVGGKWTNYRKMAEDVVDRAGEILERQWRPCQTDTLPLLGAEGYHSDLAARLCVHANLPQEIAEHLAHAYGDRAWDVLRLAPEGRQIRLAKAYPYIEAEVRYAVRNEMACTVDDVLARRTRLAFVDRQASNAARPRVAEIMKEESAGPGTRAIFKQRL